MWVVGIGGYSMKGSQGLQLLTILVDLRSSVGPVSLAFMAH